MERRRALAIAAATATTTVGAVAAIAVNFGLLGFGAAHSTPVGKLDAGRVSAVVDPAAGPSAAATPAPNVTVRYEDIYLPAPPATPAAAQPAGDPAGPERAGTSGGSDTEDSGTGFTDAGQADDGAPTVYEEQYEAEHEEGHEEGHEEDD